MLFAYLRNRLSAISELHIESESIYNRIDILIFWKYNNSRLCQRTKNFVFNHNISDKIFELMKNVKQIFKTYIFSDSYDNMYKVLLLIFSFIFSLLLYNYRSNFVVRFWGTLKGLDDSIMKPHRENITTSNFISFILMLLIICSINVIALLPMCLIPVLGELLSIFLHLPLNSIHRS